MEDKKINVKKIMKLEEVITYLDDLKSGFNSGMIVVEHRDEKTEMEVADLVTVELKVKKKKGKNKFCLELSWLEGDLSDDDPFKITDRVEVETEGAEEVKEAGSETKDAAQETELDEELPENPEEAKVEG